MEEKAFCIHCFAPSFFYFRKTSQYGSRFFTIHFLSHLTEFQKNWLVWKAADNNLLYFQFGPAPGNFRKTSQYGSVFCLEHVSGSPFQFQKNQLVWKRRMLVTVCNTLQNISEKLVSMEGDDNRYIVSLRNDNKFQKNLAA